MDLITAVSKRNDRRKGYGAPQVEDEGFLAESLELIMQDKPFEKITIKQICDRAGVIRATFYNHFEDKYAALDYIADVLLHEEQKPAAHSGDILRVILSLSETMYEHRVFLLHAFQVQGQNDFDHMFVKHLGELIEEVLLIMRHDARKASLYSNEALARYFANAFMFLCKQWLREGCRYTPQEFAAYSNGLLMNGLKDFFGKNKV